jgi:hypothetical protein
LDKELARAVTEAAKETGLTRAELMRQAIAFGLPKVVKALRRAPARLTSVDPLPARQARSLYGLADDDAPQTTRLMSAQSLEVGD